MFASNFPKRARVVLSLFASLDLHVETSFLPLWSFTNFFAPVHSVTSLAKQLQLARATYRWNT